VQIAQRDFNEVWCLIADQLSDYLDGKRIEITAEFDAPPLHLSRATESALQSRGFLAAQRLEQLPWRIRYGLTSLAQQIRRVKLGVTRTLSAVSAEQVGLTVAAFLVKVSSKRNGKSQSCVGSGIGSFVRGKRVTLLD
jgi:hypothetical protein